MIRAIGYLRISTVDQSLNETTCLKNLIYANIRNQCATNAIAQHARPSLLLESRKYNHRALRKQIVGCLRNSFIITEITNLREACMAEMYSKFCRESVLCQNTYTRIAN